MTDSRRQSAQQRKRPRATDAEALDDVSAFETCGFFSHVLIVLLGASAAIFAYVSEPTTVTATDKDRDVDEYVDEYQEGVQMLWSLVPSYPFVVLLVRVATALLVSVPFVYFLLNHWSVPPMDAIDTLSDEFTRRSATSAATRFVSRQQVCWIVHPIDGRFDGDGLRSCIGYSLTKAFLLHRTDKEDNQWSVPATVDLDVAAINDLLWTRHSLGHERATATERQVKSN
jgi:hypothetical protein